MSTKFNRNDPEASNDRFYIEDYQTDINSIEQELKDSKKHFEILPCIITGLIVTVDPYPAQTFNISSGFAYDQDANPIPVPVGIIGIFFNPASPNNYIILRHKTSTDTPRQAYLSGNEYDTRMYDDYEIIVSSSYTTGDIILGNIRRENNQNVLYSTERTPDVARPFAIQKPPVPTRLTLSTGYDEEFRSEIAGLVSLRSAYIKAEFGDKGTGTASGQTFTITQNRVGPYQNNEWIGQYLTCSDGNSWRVISNTQDTLYLETGAQPVSGTFILGPNAAGYKWVIQTLAPDTEQTLAIREEETQYTESPVKMETVWHGLTPGIKYKIKVASKGSWFQKDWSDYSAPQTITAGGPKQIPEDCSDALINLVINAQDDGIHLAWEKHPDYAAHIAGFEIVYTDDDSEPDFNNQMHRKIYTDRDHITLPSRYSTSDTLITVKAKIRAVDRAGRHCTIPKSIPPVTAKKYPADLSNLVTDYKNTLNCGSFATLKDLLSHSIDLSTGRGKAISEIESEIADARGSYPNLGQRLSEILSAGIDWKYVRIIAQDSTGHYSSIQEAINNLPDEKLYIFLVMPGTYQEIIDIGTKKIGIIGIGHSPESVVKINGRIKTSGSYSNIFTLENLYIVTGSTTEPGVDIKPQACYPVYIHNVKIIANSDIAGLRYYPATGAGIILDNVRISNLNQPALKIGPASDEYTTVKIHNSDLSSGDADTIYIDPTTGTDILYLGVINSIFRASSSKYSINAPSGAQSRLIIDIVNAILVNALAPNSSNLTVRYGTAENISCVRFTDFMPMI